MIKGVIQRLTALEDWIKKLWGSVTNIQTQLSQNSAFDMVLKGETITAPGEVKTIISFVSDMNITYSIQIRCVGRSLDIDEPIYFNQIVLVNDINGTTSITNQANIITPMQGSELSDTDIMSVVQSPNIVNIQVAGSATDVITWKMVATFVNL